MRRAKITAVCFVMGGMRRPGDIVIVSDGEFAAHCMEEVTEQQVAEESPGEGEQPEAADSTEGAGQDQSQTRKRVVKKN